MSSKFMIVVPDKKSGLFEVGLADGIQPWQLHAACPDPDVANRICTMLAMHYRVTSYPVSPGEIAVSKAEREKT